MPVACGCKQWQHAHVALPLRGPARTHLRAALYAKLGQLQPGNTVVLCPLAYGYVARIAGRVACFFVAEQGRKCSGRVQHAQGLNGVGVQHMQGQANALELFAQIA